MAVGELRYNVEGMAVGDRGPAQAVSTRCGPTFSIANESRLAIYPERSSPAGGALLIFYAAACEIVMCGMEKEKGVQERNEKDVGRGGAASPPHRPQVGRRVP